MVVLWLELQVGITEIYFFLFVKLAHTVDVQFTTLLNTMPTDTNGTSAKDAKALEQLELDTKSAQQLQRRVLQEILEHNAQTEYLQRHGLKGCTDEASFKACVPMITYPDIEGEIERIADGDASSILCADTIHRFSLRYITRFKVKVFSND